MYFTVSHCFTNIPDGVLEDIKTHREIHCPTAVHFRAFSSILLLASPRTAAAASLSLAVLSNASLSLCSMLMKGMFPPCGRSLNYDASGPGTHQIFININIIKHLSFPKHKNNSDRAVFMSVPSGGDGCAFRCASRCALRGFCGCGSCGDGFDWALAEWWRQRWQSHSHTNKVHVEQFMLSLRLLSRFSSNDLLNS